MSEINFPGSAVDGSTFFHEDSVCLYHAATNSWECRTIVQPTEQPPDQNVYITTPSVYTLGDKRTEWQSKLGTGGISFALPTVRTQAEVNDAIMDLICYIRSGSIASVTGASEAWVQANYAAINHVHSEYVTKADYNAMVTTLMTAIANNANT